MDDAIQLNCVFTVSPSQTLIHLARITTLSNSSKTIKERRTTPFSLLPPTRMATLTCEWGWTTQARNRMEGHSRSMLKHTSLRSFLPTAQPCSRRPYTQKKTSKLSLTVSSHRVQESLQPFHFSICRPRTLKNIVFFHTVVSLPSISAR